MIARDVTPLAPQDVRLETPRLVMEPIGPGPEDLELTRALLTDPEVTRYVMDPLAPEAVATEHALCSRRGAGGRFGIWKLTVRATGAAIGSGVLLPLPIELEDTDWSLLVEDRYPDAEIEVGYLLRPMAWGRGYATEACRRLLQFGFERTALDEIVAVTDVDNVASQHVLTKCGMRAEGLRRAYRTQCPSFRMTRRDWVASGGDRLGASDDR